jgi:predicted permease
MRHPNIHRPPRLAAWLLSWTTPPRDREVIVGDLAEEFAERSDADPRAAAGWYRAQVVGSLASNLGRRRSCAIERRSRGGAGMRDTLMQDLRFAARTLSRTPAFASALVLTLALGVGASTVIFSLVDGLVLNPFPYPRPEQLVTVGSEFPKLGQELSFFENLSPAEYLDIARDSRTLRNVVAWDMGQRQVASAGPPQNVFSAFWWGDAFATLEMAPALGRGFLAEEIRRGDRVAVVSHRLWQSRFAGDPGLVGGILHVNGVPYTVVGVMAPRVLVYGTDLWTPMPVGPEAFPRERRQFQVLARLAPGATLSQAATELAALAGGIDAGHRQQLPEYEGWRLQPVTWTDANVRDLRPAAAVLAAAVGLVMFLACANVASLLLARSSSRRAEVAVRVALGAGRGRLVRQLLVESVAVAVAAGALGALFASLGVEALASLLSGLSMSIPGELALNVRVFAFALCLSVVAGLLFGLAPALHAVRENVQGSLRAEGVTTTAGSRRIRTQRLFVGLEVALATVLLTGGGLLLHSFVRLQRVDPGFAAAKLLTFRLTLAQEKYQGAAIGRFFQDLVTQLEQVPAVEAAAATSQFPPSNFSRAQLRIDGAEPASDDALPGAFATIASRGYFRALGLPVLRGRTFTDRDRAEAPRVAVVSEAAAHRLFGGLERAVGRRFRMRDDPGGWFEVVGVVGSARNRGLDAPSEPEVYASLDQFPAAWNQLFVVLRAARDPRALLSSVRSVVRSLDPTQPIYGVQTVEEAFAGRALPRRVATVLVAAFAAFALALALSGVYAVVAYAAAARTREIGVRIAIGASAPDVLMLMARQALPAVGLGLLGGLAGAVAVSRFLGALLFEVRGSDPLTLAGVALLFAATAALAAYGPARRASRMDPVKALRAD